MAGSSGSGFLKGLGIVFLILVAIAAGSGLFLYQSYQRMAKAADALSSEVNALQDAVGNGDADGIRQVIGSIDNDAHVIHGEASGPLWALAEYAPIVGQDIKTARTLADVLVDLNDNVLVPLGKKAEYLTIDGYYSGTELNLDGIGELANIAQQAGPVVERSWQTVDSLPEPQSARLRDALQTARESLEAANEALSLINGLIDAVEQAAYGQW